MEHTMNRRFDPEKVKALRRDRRMSQRSFSVASKIPIDTVREYEQGRTVPSVERLATMADTLRCQIDDLFTDES